MKINYLIISILAAFWSCQDYDHDSGINEPINYTLWEYLQTDHYHYDSIVAAINYAGLEFVFQRNDITFFAVSNHSVNQFLFKTVDDKGERIYKCIRDIPEDLLTRMILSYVVEERILSTDCDFEEKGQLKGGKIVETMQGSHLRCFRRTSDYDGAADKGPQSFYIHSQETDRIIYINGKNFVSTTGILHRLSNTHQWVEL